MRNNIIIFSAYQYLKRVTNMLKIEELTKENENQYLDQIAELEQITLDAMEKEGREGQL